MSAPRNPADLSRRGLLVGASCLLPQAAGAASLTGERAERWLRPGLQMFRHRTSARVVGQRYLAADRDAGRVVVAAILRLEQRAGIHPGQSDADLILGAVESDFAAARTIEVEGWVLSETEIAFCALAATDAA